MDSRDRARDHASDDVARMLKFNQLIKYDSYMWNYVRLAPKFYKEFLADGQGVSSCLDAGSWTILSRGSVRISLPSSKISVGWVDEHPTFATDGSLGRAKYYASVGGPGVLAAFLIESLRG